jgi:hypothetical protein
MPDPWSLSVTRQWRPNGFAPERQQWKWNGGVGKVAQCVCPVCLSFVRLPDTLDSVDSLGTLGYSLYSEAFSSLSFNS